jgi:hypothetical protein
VKVSAQMTAFQQTELLRQGMTFSFRPGWSELSAAAGDGERILCAIEVANEGGAGQTPQCAQSSSSDAEIFRDRKASESLPIEP